MHFLLRRGWRLECWRLLVARGPLWSCKTHIPYGNVCKASTKAVVILLLRSMHLLLDMCIKEYLQVIMPLSSIVMDEDALHTTGAILRTTSVVNPHFSEISAEARSATEKEHDTGLC
jgi:hypothetical protein